MSKCLSTAVAAITVTNSQTESGYAVSSHTAAFPFQILAFSSAASGAPTCSLRLRLGEIADAKRQPVAPARGCWGCRGAPRGCPCASAARSPAPVFPIIYSSARMNATPTAPAGLRPEARSAAAATAFAISDPTSLPVTKRKAVAVATASRPAGEFT
jgi:hypothetical protein